MKRDSALKCGLCVMMNESLLITQKACRKWPVIAAAATKNSSLRGFNH
jgi:hypothetical protein